MKVLKNQRELRSYDFRLAGGGNAKVEMTLCDPANEPSSDDERLIFETGPAGARQKFYVPLKGHKTLIETINDNDEVLPGAILLVEYLKDTSEGEGEFVIHFDDERSPKKTEVTE